MSEREILTWPGFGEAAREMAQAIADSDFSIDIMLTITRGGMIPAGALSYDLSIKNLHVVNVEFYTGIDSRLSEPVILPPGLQLDGLEHCNMLIVDDVADTGKTLVKVRDICEPYVREIRTAVLYEKPQSLIQCDYVWKRTDKWINFPWSTLTPVVETEVVDA